MKEAEYVVPMALLPKQAEFVRWDPENLSRPSIQAILGWWGSGKTSSAALKFLRLICEQEWHIEKNAPRPQFAAMAPSTRVVEKVLLAQMERIIPAGLIARKWLRPYPKFRFVHGPELNFVSADAKFEGESLAGLWVDEIHLKPIAHDTSKFINLYARLRDPFARQLALICSGLPESGWVRQTFDPAGFSGEDRASRLTMLTGYKDNPFLPEGQESVILSSLPDLPGIVDAVKHGGWFTDPESLFPMWSDDGNLVDFAVVDDRAPPHMGIDVGNHGGVVFGHDRNVMVKDVVGGQHRVPGLVVFDEYLSERQSVEDMIIAVKTRPAAHRLVRGRSKIYVDPTIRRDEENAIRRHFPGIEIVIRNRKDEFYEVMPGVRVMQRALRDSLSNTRLFFTRNLVGRKSGIIDAILGSRTSKVTGLPVKNDRTDHIRDALRYLVQGRLGDPMTFAMKVH